MALIQVGRSVRINRVRMALLLGLAELGLLGCGDVEDSDFSLAAEPSMALREFEAPTVLAAPAIDGVVDAVEWAESNSYEVELVNESSGTLTATWRYMSDDDYLYIGVETTTTADWDSVAVVVIDGNDDEFPGGSLSEPHQDFSVGQAGPGGWPGHTSYVVYTGGGTANQVSPPAGLQRASSGGTDISYEFRIPISSLNLVSGQIAMKLAVYQGGLPLDEYVYLYPAQASFAQPAWQNADEWPLVGL